MVPTFREILVISMRFLFSRETGFDDKLNRAQAPPMS